LCKENGQCCAIFNKIIPNLQGKRKSILSTVLSSMQKVEAITKTADEKAVTPCGALGFQVSAFYRSPAVHGHPSVP